MKQLDDIKAKLKIILDKLMSPRQKKLVLATATYFSVLVLFLISISFMSAPKPLEGHQIVVPVEKAEHVTGSAKNVSSQISAIDLSDRYIAKFDTSVSAPLISIIVTGLGLNETNTKQAILNLAPHVTLAISPYSKDTGFWVEQSIKARHETLMEIPMQPADFPNSDPGYLALLRNIDYKTNSDRLDEISSKGAAYIGFINDMGSSYLKDVNNLRGLYAWVRSQNALFVESVYDENELTRRKDFEGEQYMQSFDKIDKVATADAIAAQLRALERKATQNGYVIATAENYPVTIAVLEEWVKTLNSRNVVLAPVSAVMERRNALRR